MVGENDVLILVENRCIKNRPSNFQMLANKTWVVFHKIWISQDMVSFSPFKQTTWTLWMMVMLWGLQFFEEHRWKSSLQKCQKHHNPGVSQLQTRTTKDLEGF